ncbi:hypothetical protein TNCT_454821 [Trichonephila clavata]|uniref:Uncharacterized protein n=1 Tax=Trichonephila clavata TaxID=2740835 RepID=A0A8X6KZZ6_TRICU|nr:hypothetical protein TNCT_454821 [Trichonephila clavata]
MLEIFALPRVEDLQTSIIFQQGGASPQGTIFYDSSPDILEILAFPQVENLQTSIIFQQGGASPQGNCLLRQFHLTCLKLSHLLK